MMMTFEVEAEFTDGTIELFSVPANSYEEILEALRAECGITRLALLSVVRDLAVA